MPIYFNAAAAIDDPLERMKLVISSAVSYLYKEHSFEKPTESQLGETVQAYGQDGSRLFLEQTSIEPPTSHYLFEGPDGNYTFSGYLEINVKPGPLSSHIIPKGFRKVTFKDGQTIEYTHHDDNIYNLTYGVMGHQLMNSVEFKDEENKIEATVNFGSNTWGP